MGQGCHGKNYDQRSDFAILILDEGNMLNKHFRKFSQVALFLIVATNATASFSRNLPHVDLVESYFLKEQYKHVLANCKSRTLMSPSTNTGSELTCWAAGTANDLQKEPEAVRTLVLNGAALDAALFRCKALSMEQRVKSLECAAVGQADAFISLRQPRSVNTLKPVTFK